jgi:hypothetical protein
MILSVMLVEHFQLVRETDAVAGEFHRGTEVFSTDWSLGDGQDQSCSGNGADPLRAQPDMA